MFPNRIGFNRLTVVMEILICVVVGPLVLFCFLIVIPQEAEGREYLMFNLLPMTIDVLQV